MNSKTCLFDKATIRSDIKRFWWITAVFLILLALFVMPRAVYTVSNGAGQMLPHNSTDEGFFTVLFAFFLPGMIFSYLHKGNAVSFVHGMPPTRIKIFISHVLTGLLLLFVPIIVCGIVIGAEGLYFQGNISYALKYMYTCGVYAALIFMITTFAMLISGNTVAGLFFSLSFIVFPAFAVELSEMVLGINLFGFAGYERDIINRIYLISVEEVCSRYSLLYLLLTAVLFGVCIWLYKIRKLENYDEVLAFRPLKTVFMYAAAICFGYFGYALFYDITDINALFLAVLPIGFVALTAAFMLNKKSFSLKGIIKHLIIFTAVAAVVKVTVAYDLTGYERHVPEISEIASIDPYKTDVETTYAEPYASDSSDDEFVNYLTVAPVDAQIKDEKTMADIINLHKNIIERGRLAFRRYGDSDVWNKTIELTYNLKNGRQLIRRYMIYRDDYADCIAPYYENPQYTLAHYPMANDRKKEIKYVMYRNPVLQSDVQLVGIDNEKLLEAVRTDTENLDYEGLSYDTEYYFTGESLEINYTEDVESNGRNYEFIGSENIALSHEYKNTLALINEEMKKYPDRYIDPDNVGTIYLTSATHFEGSSEESEATVTDKAEIKAIYDALRTNSQYVDSNSDNKTLYDIQLTLARQGETQQGQYIVTITKPYNEIPEPIRKYVTEERADARTSAGKTRNTPVHTVKTISQIQLPVLRK